MAIFHLSAKIISRGKGQSAVASAAYRSASKLKDDFNQKTFDYSRKSEVAFTKIFLPDNAPKEFYDRETLWNNVENFEKQKNAQLAREIEFALPIELNFEQQKKLACDFAQSFADVGMCVDLAFHNKKNNPHCHLMLTTRSLDEKGNWLPKNKVSYKLDENGNKIPVLDKNGFQKKEKNGKKIFEKIASPTNDWNNKNKVEEWRKIFQDLANLALQNSNSNSHIDHRSYKRQGVFKIPTVHLGSSDALKERKGQSTERGDLNRQIYFANQILENIKNHSDAVKKIPPPNDPRSFWLWSDFAKQNIENEQKQLQKNIFSGFEKNYIDVEKHKFQQLIDQEKKSCQEKILQIQNQTDSEKISSVEIILKLQHQIDDEQKNLFSTNEKILQQSAEFKNRETAKFELANTRKLCDELKKTWDYLYNELSNLKSTDQNYNLKLQEYNNARADYQETFAKTIPQKQEKVKIAEELLEKKRLALPSSNSKINALKKEISKVQSSTDKKTDALKLQIEKVENNSNNKIADFESQIKNLDNSTNLKMSELKKDADFLNAIRHNFTRQFNQHKDPLFKNKSSTEYTNYLKNHQITLNLNVKNCDTSAKFTRQLRLAEQNLPTPSALAELAKILAHPLVRDNAPAYSGNSERITDIGFEMDKDWNLMDELEKDEIAHKKTLARI